MYAFGLLQRGQNAGEVRGRRAAFWTQHAHQALGGNLRPPFQVLKTDGRVHIVAEHGLPGVKIAVDDALDGFPQECLAEIGDRAAPAPGWSP